MRKKKVKKIRVRTADNRIATIDENEAKEALRAIRMQEQKKMGKAPKKKKKKKKRSFGKIFAKFLVFNFVLITILACFVYMQYTDTFSNVNTVKFPSSKKTLGISSNAADLDKNVMNIALFGTDSRGEEQCRTDTIMVCSLNMKTGDINLTSILRDSLIRLDVDDNMSYEKINAAYFYGGAKQAVRVINQNFDMNIKDFMLVDFTAIADLVDAIDGITVDVDESEVSDLNYIIAHTNRVLKGNSPSVEAGKQKLDGKQALSYCRIRHNNNGDFDRTARQRLVIKKIFKKLKKEKSIPKFKKAVKAVLPYITTSMNSNDFIIPLITYFRCEKGPQSHALTRSEYARLGMFNGGSCILFDTQAAATQDLHDIIYDTNGNYTLSDTAQALSDAMQEKLYGVTMYTVEDKNVEKGGTN